MRLAAIAWRGLRARPLRSGLTIAGVALGVAVTCGTLVTTQAADRAVRSAATELLGRADLRVRAFEDAGFTPRTVQALRSLEGVVAGAPVAERRLTVGVEPDRVFTLLVLGLDPEADSTIRDPHLVAGVGLSSDSPTDALLPASWAAGQGLGLGTELFLSGHIPGTPPLRVVGLVDDVGFAALERGEVLITSRAALDAAFTAPAPIRYVDLDVGQESADQMAQRIAAVSAAVEASLAEPFVLETADDAAARLASAQVSFAGVAFLFGLVALVVGAFLVANTLTMTVGERTRDIGLLRAAGANASQIRGIFLRQGLALGVAGAIVGVIGGIGVAALMITFVRASRAALVEGLPLAPATLVIPAALGVGVTLAAAAFPAARAASLTPIEALRPPGVQRKPLLDRLRWLVVAELVVVVVGLLVVPGGAGGPSIAALVLSLALLLGGAVATALLLEPVGRVVGRPFEWFFGAQGLLGRLNLARDPARTGLTVGALMIGLATAVTVGSVAESSRIGAQRWIASILPGGYAIRIGAPLEIETFHPTIAATPGAQAATPIVEVSAVVREGDVQREIGLAGIDPNTFSDAGALRIAGASRAQAFEALRGGGAVLVPAPFATRNGTAVGEVLEIGRAGAEPSVFRVAGVVEASLPARTSDGALLISLSDARDLFGATAAGLWAVIPREGVSPSAFAAAVRQTAADLGGEGLTAAELADDLGRGIERLIGLFDALAGVAILIAALGIVNTLAVGVTERVREIAILRANGMTAGQVQAMVVTEASIMGAIGGIAAVVIGLLVAWVLVGTDDGSALTAGFIAPWSLLLAVVLLGTGVAALAGLYPARLAGSLPFIGAMKRFE